MEEDKIIISNLSLCNPKVSENGLHFVMIYRYSCDKYFQHRKIKTNTKQQTYTRQREVERMKIAIIW